MMKLKKLLNVVALLFVGIVFANAETTVMGTVTDASGEALIGVSVKIKGTPKGTITDINGKFGLSVPGTYSVLAFSYIGYESQEVKVGIQKVFTVIMQSNSKNLDEVVVMGYGEIKKRDLTGSVAKADLESMLKMPVANLDQALAGRVAGVQVSSSEGTPGGEMNIVVRGTNSITGSNAPLYVIDGFPMEDGSASNINPNDVESMEVLKDASATAIYGARGANGVIIITTKKGKVGAPMISYDGSFGVQRASNRMPTLDAYEFVKLQSETTAATEMKNRYFSTDPSGKTWTLEDYINAKTINWEDMVLRDAPMQNHSLGITGGKDDSRYAASLSYFNQDGILVNTNYNRLQGKITNTIKKKNLTIYLNANYSKTTQFGARPSENSWAAANNLFSNVWGYRPALYPNQTDESLIENSLDETMITDYRVNPLLSLKEEYNKSNRAVLMTNGFLEYEFIKGLKLKTSMGYTEDNLLKEAYNNSKSRYGNPRTNINGVNATVATASRQTWLNENTLSYIKSLNKVHNFNALLGYTMQASDAKNFSSQTIQIPSQYEIFGIDQMGAGTPFTMGSSASRWTMMSYLGRLNYNFKNRYYVTASYRADGSSRFKGDNQFGYFPSGSLAWNFTEERFMKPISSMISSGKLRLSWGVTGNNRVGDYDTYAILSKIDGGSYAGVYPFDNVVNSVGLVPTSMANKVLRWESTAQWNAGMDVSFLNQSIFLTVDIYKKNTSDLLLNAKLPYSSGYPEGYKNIGETENKGIEFTINTKNVKTKNFTWSTNFNISFNQNKVLALTDNQKTLLVNAAFDQGYNGMPNYFTQIGYPLGLMYGYIYEGTYKYEDFNYDPSSNIYTIKTGVPTFTAEAKTGPGYPKYSDLNGDGKIDSNDQTVIGRGTPTHIGGINNTFTYKGFDFSFFFQWSYGNNILSANQLLYGVYNGKTLTNLFDTYKDRWSPTNPTSDIPAAAVLNATAGNPTLTYSSSLSVFSSRVIEDGSFLRLKNINFGYNLNPKVLKILKLNKVRLFVNANDIWVLTGYKGGYDPEVSVRNSALTPGFDFSAYPRALSINGGVNIIF
jgi:TonB-linked SusC/RagA family outer membrane protein